MRPGDRCTPFCCKPRKRQPVSENHRHLLFFKKRFPIFMSSMSCVSELISRCSACVFSPRCMLKFKTPSTKREFKSCRPISNRSLRNPCLYPKQNGTAHPLLPQRRRIRHWRRDAGGKNQNTCSTDPQMVLGKTWQWESTITAVGCSR